MKKTVCVFLIFFCVCAALPGVFAAGPSNSAVSAVLIDADNGTVLYEDNADEQMLIASTTKILTALVVLENCGSDESVRIKKEYTNVEGSSMYLQEGDELTVRELLYGLLLASGNDAAVALACYAGGSAGGFASMMNERAFQIGCRDSSFKNPHGLDEDGHYSTARDLAHITEAAMENKLFCEIVSTKSVTIKGRTYRNHNKLLWNYEGALGVKTGYTKSAGRSLVSSAERNGLRLICVTLNDPDDWTDHENLYNWAFSEYKRVTVSYGDTDIEPVPVISGEQEFVRIRADGFYSCTIPKEDSVDISVYLPKFVYAGVDEGEQAGLVAVKYDGAIVGRIPLYYAEEVALDKTVPLTVLEKIGWSWFFANRYGLNRFGGTG